MQHYFSCLSLRFGQGAFQLLDPSLQLIDPAAKFLDLGLRAVGGNRLRRLGTTERRPLRRSGARRHVARWRRDGFRSSRHRGRLGGGAARRAQLCCARRRAQDDFGPQRPISTDQLQRQAVARIEAVENGREFAEQVDLAARRGDDQILGLQAGAIGRPAAADAQHPHAAADIVVGKCAKIDPLGRRQPPLTGGPLEVRMPDSNRSNSPCAAAGDVPPSPAASNITIPMPQVFFMFRRPFLKGSLSHTMEDNRHADNYTGIPPRRTAYNGIHSVA